MAHDSPGSVNTSPALGALRSRLIWAPAFLAGAASIGSLLLYFYGLVPMASAASVLLLPTLLVATAHALWARASGRVDFVRKLMGACWAGGLATLAYDIVRTPISEAGIPVYKAISYFGTVLLAEPTPTLATEILGWAYHFSNGVGFAVMYVALFAKPKWWSAVAWGCTLEGVMLLTPYAEVFGYQRSGAFLAITLSAHIVYGFSLWLALRWWEQRTPARRAGSRPLRLGLASGWVGPVIGIALIAASANRSHAQRLPPSAPSYLGPHLYTTWNVLELDRLLSMWILRRKVEPLARFHFVEPFSAIRQGTPFDVPNAEIRRLGNRSTTEVLLERQGLTHDPRLSLLARIAHHYEISPWMVPSDPDCRTLGRELEQLSRACQDGPNACSDKVFARLDAWFDGTK